MEVHAMDAATVGSNIKKYRERLGFSQKDVSDYLGITRAQISNYENGKREVPVVQLKKIADLFGVTLSELLEKEEAKKSANLAFAFRSDDLTQEDFEKMAWFKRIVKNHQKMLSIKDGSS